MHQLDLDIRSRLLMAHLPAMPQILLKLMEQCQADEAGMGVLAELIAKDPGMSCKVLGVANSSAYHRGGARVGLEKSLTTIGMDMIKTLVISESVFQVFNGFTHSNNTDLRSFWKHSLYAAVMARGIAEKIGYPNVEEAYLAGMLHDVGRLALLAAATKEYAFLFFARDDENLCVIEQSMLNMTHCEAGAWLVERWNMDSFLADSLRYHHEPVVRIETAHPLVRIVLLAHLVSLHAENDPTVNEAVLMCGIQAADLERIIEASHSKVEQFASLLGIDLSGADDLTVPTAGWEIAGLLAKMNEGNESTAPTPVRESDGQQVQDKAQKLLVEEVRNTVLSSELARSFSRQQGGEAALIETIARSARILFDLENVVILRMNDSGEALVGVPVGEHQQRLKEFSIALAGDGIIARTVLQRRISFIARGADQQSIAESQLFRVLDSESLVCLPLSSWPQCQGVLIGGIAAWQVPVLQNRERFLKSFGEQAASHIQATTAKAEKISLQVDSAAEEYRDASRRVVHEANNSLSIIKNYLGVLDSKLGKHELAGSELSILHEEIGRVGQIIRGFVDPEPSVRASVADVNRVVREVIHLFRESKSVPASVKIAVQTLETPSEVAVSVASLKQILVNLVKNSIEAMPAGGEIQVLNNGHVNHDGLLYIELCIRDNGPGITPRILEVIFSPGQTTKQGEHRGLGLSIVHDLVKQSQGLITCRSSPTGTAFEILLPIHKHS